MLLTEPRWQDFTTPWFFATALIVVRLPAVRRLGQVRHQWQVEEPVGQADEDRLEPRPDLWAHPPVRVRSTRRGGRDPAAKKQCQAYRGEDNQYSRSCHTGVSHGSALTATGAPPVFRKPSWSENLDGSAAETAASQGRPVPGRYAVGITGLRCGCGDDFYQKSGRRGV